MSLLHLFSRLSIASPSTTSITATTQFNSTRTITTVSSYFTKPITSLSSSSSSSSSFPSTSFISLSSSSHPLSTFKRYRHSHGVIVQNKTRRGLFARKHIKFGNTVSHSHMKTRRSWQPNVQNKTYFSELLNKKLKLKVTTHAIRWIDKRGGLDNYLLHTRDKDLGEGLVLDLKAEVQQALKAKQLAAKAGSITPVTGTVPAARSTATA